MKCLRYYLCLASVGILMGCQYEFPEEIITEPHSGQADFSKMVAIGNSLTAGYMDGALYNRGQQNSFVVILAEQMKMAGGGEFNVPEINSETGFFAFGENGPLGRLVLTYDTTTSSTEPPPATPAPIGPGDFPGPYTGDKSMLNNFGVPGITLVTALIPDTGNPTSPLFNPYYGRMASSPGSSTVIGDAANALANGGTFFSFWLGNPDVVNYAIGGASNPFLLTEEVTFNESLNAALGAMLNANPEAKGVVMTIPNLNIFPYFNLINPLRIPVPPAARPPLGEGLAQLNAAINGWNQGVNANPNIPDPVKPSLIRPTLSTDFDAYPLLILDPSLSDAEIPLPTGESFVIPKIRNLTTEDEVKIPLGAQASLIQGVGISPMSPLNEAQYDSVYLSKSEQAEIQDKINKFNNFIGTAVADNGERLLLVDVNDFLGRLIEDTAYSDEIRLKATIIPPNGAFSLDGLHPNARGNAFLANFIIDGINDKWEANLPKANPNAFPGNDLPR
ncbi:MAG: hypothetical protein WD426_00985 [Anditalea sp.]